MDLPTYVHLDAAQLTALAQPLRVRLLAALRLSGPSTATLLAERLSSNTGKTSYHLRKLAEVGLVVEEAGLGDDRDRWWRAAHDITTWRPEDFDDDADAAVAARWLQGHVARNYAAQVENWLASCDEWPEEWVRSADMSDLRITLSAARLRQLNDELLAVVNRYMSAVADRPSSETTGPPSAESPERQACTVIIQAFPNPNPVI
jgi:DNA-binding transcriptional ArsR family regulator